MIEHIHAATGRKLMRGLIPTPRHILRAAIPYVPGKADTPPYYFAFPAQMSMWGNDVDGDCVSAEEAMNKAVGGIFVSEADVIAWATKNGDLNGANLLPVIDQMAAAGMPSGAGIFGDGSPPTSVDYTNTTTLRNAIYEALSSTPAGTIKIGLAAGQLPSGAGNASGWFLVGASPDTNEDHCMCYCGYGTAQQFVDAINSTYGLNVTVPSGIDPTTEGYAAYTWNTIGFFDAVTNANIVGEAWIRQPSTTTQTNGAPVADKVTVIGGDPTPPPPPPPPAEDDGKPYVEPPPPPPNPLCNRPIVLFLEAIQAFISTLPLPLPPPYSVILADIEAALAILCPPASARIKADAILAREKIFK